MFFLLFDKKKSQHLSWTEFYKDTAEPTNENGLFQNYTGSNKQTLSESQTWVIKCYFHDMSTQGDGGAINSKSLNKLLIETSTFVNCSASNNGGAIFISSGDCVIHEVCGYQCTSTDSSFAYVFGDSSSYQK